MLKRNFIFFILLAGCSTSNEIEKKELISSIVEPNGLNCANGGIKIISGTDLNGNTKLELSEVTSSKMVCLPDAPPNYEGSKISTLDIVPNDICVNGGLEVTFSYDSKTDDKIGYYKEKYFYQFCHDSEGIYEMMNGFKLPELLNVSDTVISEEDNLQNFDIDNFSEFDLVKYSFQYLSFDDNLEIEVQLFNKTDETPISGSEVRFIISMIGDLPAGQSDFRNGFPHKKIEVALKVKKDPTYGGVDIKKGILEFSKSSLR